MKKITLLLLFIPLISLAQIRIYPLDGNASDLISGQNGTLGTASNAPTDTIDRFGNPGSAYYFDGDDYITIPETGLTTNNFSLSAWITVSVLPTNLQDFYSIGSINGDQTFGVGNDINGTGFFQAGYSIDGPCCPRVYWDTIPQTNQWYHYVLTRSSSEMKLFINGSLVKVVDTQFAPNYGSTPAATIGSREVPAYQAWKGMIDDLRLFDYTLNDSSAISIYIPEVTKEENAFNIFPNPTKKHFTIELSNEFAITRLEICNVLGEIIYEKKSLIIPSSISIPISFENISSGTYFVKVFDHKRQFTKRLIIE